MIVCQFDNTPTTVSKLTPLPPQYGYFLLALQFMAWLALSAVFILILWVWDSANGGYLNASPAKRKEMNE